MATGCCKHGAERSGDSRESSVYVITLGPGEARRCAWLITLAAKDTEETLRDAQSCAPSRFENFLRDDGPHRLVYYGKGLDFVATALSKAKSKNAGIRDRTGHLEVRCPKSTCIDLSCVATLKFNGKIGHHN